MSGQPTDLMDYGFQEPQTPYVSPSQSARVWTEAWVIREMYCPACGETALRDLPNNSPVADLDCEACREQYELKATKAAFRRKVVDGAYSTMIARLESETAPSLMLLRYNKQARAVRDVEVIPKEFFVPSIIERRKTLGPNARRAGWTGCNILLDRIPSIGRIPIIQDQTARSVEDVTRQWKATGFVSMTTRTVAAKGWLLDVLRCVERIGRRDFTLADVYRFEDDLGTLYPNNRNVRPKIRQQLQVLRDAGAVSFEGGGQYRLMITGQLD